MTLSILVEEIREGGGSRGAALTDIDAIGANRLHTLRLVSGAQVSPRPVGTSHASRAFPIPI